jgi:hypothetical protein
MERVKFKPKFEALDADLPDEHPEPPKSGGGGFLGWLNPFGSSAPAKSVSSSGAGGKTEEKLRKLTADYQAKTAEIIEKWKRIGEEAVPIQVKPRKVDVRVTHFGLGWVPYWRRPGATGQVELVPAY